jgi:pimeloyl-ACP methyl ester carboxylesterase
LELSALTRGVDRSGVPILLVHGLASNAGLWDGVADALSSMGHPVVAIDQRGHGWSSKPATGYDFETLTADLLAAIAEVGWSGRSPFVAGQSWGGNVVLELAARHPADLAGIALVDGGTIELSSRFADWPTCEAAMAPPVLLGTKASDFERLIRTHHPDWPESGISGTLANVELPPDGTIRPWLSRDNHMTILRHMWEHHPSERYGFVALPTLMVMAEDPSNQRWMAGKRREIEQATTMLKRADIHWIQGDHDLHAQHPGLVADLIHRAACASAADSSTER